MTPLRHLISIDDISGAELKALLMRAGSFEREHWLNDFNNLLSGKIIATLFFQPSTRTQYGFKSTVMRLGGQVLNVELESSRAGSNWGESLADTARVISGLADMVVIRHSSAQGVYDFAAHSTIPVINAGNGMGLKAEHPTQALTDLYTIQKTFKKIDGLRILIIGGTHLRAFRSQIRALAHFPEANIMVLCPDKFWMEFSDREFYRQNNINFTRIGSLEEVVSEIDVLYHNGITEARDEVVDSFYAISAERLQTLRDEAIVLHALPRVEDLHESVDSIPQARYFEQAHNGNALRCAVIEHFLTNLRDARQL